MDIFKNLSTRYSALPIAAGSINETLSLSEKRRSTALLNSRKDIQDLSSNLDALISWFDEMDTLVSDAEISAHSTNQLRQLQNKGNNKISLVFAGLLALCSVDSSLAASIGDISSALNPLFTSTLSTPSVNSIKKNTKDTTAQAMNDEKNPSLGVTQAEVDKLNGDRPFGEKYKAFAEKYAAFTVNGEVVNGQGNNPTGIPSTNATNVAQQLVQQKIHETF